MFISEFILVPEFRGTGLAQQVLQNFLAWLPGLSRTASVRSAGRCRDVRSKTRDVAYSGIVTLSPAEFRTVMRELGERGTPKQYRSVEEKLIRSYEKAGFEVWWKGDERRGGSAITVMGRRM